MPTFCDSYGGLAMNKLRGQDYAKPQSTQELVYDTWKVPYSDNFGWDVSGFGLPVDEGDFEMETATYNSLKTRTYYGGGLKALIIDGTSRQAELVGISNVEIRPVGTLVKARLRFHLASL
jgi:hypothetical protein